MDNSQRHDDRKKIKHCQGGRVYLPLMHKLIVYLIIMERVSMSEF